MSDAARESAGPRILRVSELAAELDGLLREAVGAVWVVGEISNLRRAASGHAWFTLKDDRGQLSAVLFRGTAARLRFEPEEGLEVLVYAEVGLYEARGSLQLVVRRLEPRGQGALQLAFEQLRTRLDREGLFAADRKRELPAHPRTLGVVTSDRAAALRDVIEVAGQRAPGVSLLIAPARVQGEGAEFEIIAALQRLAGRSEVDAILVVRGGGSLEDLQPFNTEILARALARCPIPVVSGVGHETDVTIADLAADLRAPTPSAAAAAALPDQREARARLSQDVRRMRAATGAVLRDARTRLEAAKDTLRLASPAARLAARRQRLEQADRRLRGAVAARLERSRGLLEAPTRALARVPAGVSMGPRLARVEAARGRLDRGVVAIVGRSRAQVSLAAGRLDSLSPLGVLARGYAIARRRDDGRIVRQPDEVGVGDALSIRVAGGEIEARVTTPSARSGSGAPDGAAVAPADARSEPPTDDAGGRSEP